MKKMICAAVAAAVLATSGPAMAQSKARECALQGQIWGAIQQARLGNVPKRNVPASVAAAVPGLNQAVINTVPQLANHIYGIPKRELRKVNMRTFAEEQCIANWDQIQATKNSISN